MSDPNYDVYISSREIEELLEPIQNHGHCWSLIAGKIIAAEKTRRAIKFCGPYDEWPVHVH